MKLFQNTFHLYTCSFCKFWEVSKRISNSKTNALIAIVTKDFATHLQKWFHIANELVHRYTKELVSASHLQRRIILAINAFYVVDECFRWWRQTRFTLEMSTLALVTFVLYENACSGFSHKHAQSYFTLITFKQNLCPNDSYLSYHLPPKRVLLYSGDPRGTRPLFVAC